MFVLRYFVKCMACGLEHLLFEERGPWDQERVQFNLPAGWHEGAANHYYCPQHTVVVAVLVDGQPA